MTSCLAFFVAFDQQDYNLRGQYLNYETGIYTTNSYQMFGCWTPPFLRMTPEPALVYVKLNRIEIKTTRRVLQTFNLNTNTFQLQHLTATHDQYSGDIARKLGLFPNGLYDFELMDNYGRYFFSNPFKIETPAGFGAVKVLKFYTNSPGAMLGCGIEVNVDTNLMLRYKCTFDLDYTDVYDLSQLIPITAQNSITGTGTAADPIELVNDVETPEANSVYGTDESGVKGWRVETTGITAHNDTTDKQGGVEDEYYHLSEIQVEISQQASMALIYSIAGL